MMHQNSSQCYCFIELFQAVRDLEGFRQRATSPVGSFDPFPTPLLLLNTGLQAGLSTGFHASYLLGICGRAQKYVSAIATGANQPEGAED
jgi:hypothetical protein